MRELARAWRGAPALRVCVLLAALARASAVGVVSSFTANDVQYYCEGQPFATKLPLSWAGVSRTVLPVDVTEVCAPDASGNVTSTITVNATQLAAADAANAIALIKGSACLFNRTSDYLRAFTNRLAALTNGTSTLTGVLVGEGYPGKLPELMTPVVQGGFITWRPTELPACVLSNANYTTLLASVGSAGSNATSFLAAQLYRQVDEPTAVAAGYFAAFTTGTYTLPTNATVRIMLAAATFCPATSPSITARVVAATLTDACAPRTIADCAACWAAPSPFANASALNGTVAFVDPTPLVNAGNVTFCYTYGYQYALKAQAAGALAMLLRSNAGSFEPRSKYLLPAPLRIPTFGTEHDQSQLIVAGVAAGTARITLPALVGGLGPAYYPSVMADMETSSMSVYVNLSAVSAFYCDLGQSLFQPLAWPGAPVPVAALVNTSAADFSATHRFLHARPTELCAASATCAACIEAGVHNRTSQMVIPPEIVTDLLLGTKYTLYAYGAAYPCITGFAELTDMAVALNASALVIVLGSDADPERTSTLIDSASYVARIPTFNMDYACYDRVLQRANASLPVHVSLPQLIGGVAVGAGVEAPAAVGVTRDPNTTAAPSPQSVGIPATYLLAQTTDGHLLCGDGRCRAGQTSYNPLASAAATLNATFLAPSTSCDSARECARCDALSIAAQYSANNSALNRSALAGRLAVIRTELFPCVEASRSALDAIEALGASGVVVILPASLNNTIMTLSLPGISYRPAAPTWTLTASDGAAWAALDNAGAVLRVRMPAVANGLAQLPAGWSDEWAGSYDVDLSLADGVRVRPGDDGAAEEAERRYVTSLAVGVVLLGVAGISAIIVAVLYYRRRRRQLQFQMFPDGEGRAGMLGGGAGSGGAAQAPYGSESGAGWSTGAHTPPPSAQPFSSPRSSGGSTRGVNVANNAAEMEMHTPPASLWAPK